MNTTNSKDISQKDMDTFKKITHVINKTNQRSYPQTHHVGSIAVIESVRVPG